MKKKEHTLSLKHIQAYSKWLTQEERTGATLEKYLHEVQMFHQWLGDRPVTKETVTAWKEDLSGQGFAPSTVNGYLAAVHSLLRFLGWEECRVKYLKVQREMFRDPSKELEKSEYEALVKTAKGQGKEWLVLAMETICATGIRVSELRYITVEAARKGKAVISLKGKIRVLYLPDTLCRKLLIYAKHKKITSGEIFLTERGTSMNRHRIWREMKGLCGDAGVAPEKVFPHNLRHLFATTYYKQTKDIAELAAVLGHSSIETTRIYLLTSGATLRKQLDSLGLVS